MPINVISLLRVSSEAQAGADRQGLPAQRDACEALARAHGLKIIDWIELDGVSGAAVLADPRFQSLLKRLNDPSVGGVVAAAFDRVFRPARFSDFAILDAFRDAGCRIYTASGVLDPATQNDALLGLISGHLAGAEREAIAKRTSAGRERRRRQHGVRAEGDGRNGMPRGVIFDRSVGDPGEWKYEYPAASQVRRVFDLFLGGETNLTAIGREAGLGDRKSYAVRSMLRQPLYMGVYRVDRKWVNGQPLPRDPADVYEHVVLDPPLVTPQDFVWVQARLAEIAGSRRRTVDLEDRPVDYGGFLFCNRCGSRLMVLEDHRSKIWNYRCARDHRGRTKTCDLGQFSANKVDPVVTKTLIGALSDVDTILGLVEEGIERERRDLPSPSAITRQLTQLANRRARVFEAYEAGLYELVELRKRTEGLDAERSALEASLDTLEAPEIDESVAEDLAFAFARWSRLGRTQRRKLLNAYGVRIWIDKEGRGRNAQVRVPRTEIASLASTTLYKKLKRLGID